MKIAQFSDCHLFADKKATHYGAPVFDNLTKVLAAISEDQTIDALVFTGDLSQDHSFESYQNFSEAVLASKINVPVYYLAGNHDDHQMLAQALTADVFKAEKLIENNTWQIMLCDSKGETPAGFVKQSEFEYWRESFKEDKFQFLLMHHHPIDVGYFIDRHGLTNKESFWQQVSDYPSFKGIACGHVHNEFCIVDRTTGVPLYTCPATSMQFAKSMDTVQAESITPGYRTFEFTNDGQIISKVFYIS